MLTLPKKVEKGSRSLWKVWERRQFQGIVRRKDPSKKGKILSKGGNEVSRIHGRSQTKNGYRKKNTNKRRKRSRWDVDNHKNTWEGIRKKNRGEIPEKPCTSISPVRKEKHA